MPAAIIKRGSPDSGSAVHYVLEHAEHEGQRGSYVDPHRYKPGHRDYSPEMLCGHGGFHAFGTRDRAAVTCPACAAKLPAPAGLPDAIAARFAKVRADREALGTNVHFIREDGERDCFSFATAETAEKFRASLKAAGRTILPNEGARS